MNEPSLPSPAPAPPPRVAGDAQPCPLCTASSALVKRLPWSVTSESQTLQSPSNLWACGACEHVFSTLDIDLNAYYASRYDAALTDEGMDELVTTPGGQIVFRTDLDYGLFASQALRGLAPSASMFEFGCGHGRILSRLKKHGYDNLCAFDLGTRYRDPVAALIGADRVFIGEQPTHLQFDLAFSFFVLEHDTNPVASLAYLKRITKPGGRLFLMLPNFESNSVDLACADHLHHFSPDVLSRLVEAAGFSVQQLDVTSSLGAMTLIARNDSGPQKPLRKQAPSPNAPRRLTPFLNLVERLEVLKTRVGLDRELYLYGAGFYATLAHAALGGPQLAGVFDANPRKQGHERLGCSVADPASIASGRFREARLLVCINGAVAPEIQARYAGGFAEALCL